MTILKNAITILAASMTLFVNAQTSEEHKLRSFASCSLIVVENDEVRTYPFQINSPEESYVETWNKSEDFSAYNADNGNIDHHAFAVVKIQHDNSPFWIAVRGPWRHEHEGYKYLTGYPSSIFTIWRFGSPSDDVAHKSWNETLTAHWNSFATSISYEKLSRQGAREQAVFDFLMKENPEGIFAVDIDESDSKNQAYVSCATFG